MKSTYNIALIGMGKMGRIRLNVLRELSAFSVVAVCDSHEGVEAEFSDYVYFSDWEELLEGSSRLQLDAVFVSVFSADTCCVVCAALEKGLHVFSEKPPGISLDEINKIMEAEKASAKVVKFGFNHRYHGSVMEAKRRFDAGEIGDVLWGRGVYGKSGGEEFAANWRGSRATAGGGILLDQGIHMLDLLCYFMGTFEKVESFIEQAHYTETDLEDNAFALMRTAEGKVAFLHSSATHWDHTFRLELYGSRGFLKLKGILSASMQYAPEELLIGHCYDDAGGRLKKPRIECLTFCDDQSWLFEVEEFLALLRGEDIDRHGHTEEAYRLMLCLDKIYSKETE